MRLNRKTSEKPGEPDGDLIHTDWAIGKSLSDVEASVDGGL